MAGKDKSHKKILLLSSLFLSFFALFATAVLVCLVLGLNKRLIENESAIQSIRDEINSYKKTQDGLDMLKTIRQTVDGELTLFHCYLCLWGWHPLQCMRSTVGDVQYLGGYSVPWGHTLSRVGRHL